jgi:gamma-glutamyl-gamma-aminobutyrate hydrolase PuuD
VIDAGHLQVEARAPDGVIEAVRDGHRSCYLGVQWHPERTDDPRLGLDLVRAMVT